MNNESKEAIVTTRYRSKFGIIMLVLPLLTLGTPLFEGVFQMEDFYIFLFALLLMACLYWALIYEVSSASESLLLKVGFVWRKKIMAKDIVRIEETNSIISGLALSLDRLEVFYGRDESVLISPQNKSQFISQLIKMNSNIVFKPKNQRVS